MPDHDLIASKVSFARRWHVIAEIDLMRLMADHAAISQLCDALEMVADLLPERPSAATAEQIAEGLETLLRTHNPQEERLMEAMFARDLSEPLTHSLLDHIHARHVACAVQAQDLAAALRVGASEEAIAPDALGYMLRCFFEGCRDAMVIEQLAIFALGQDRLTAGARALLTDRLAAICQAA
ncbi:hemerythrin domain-containing protein [Sphingomonas nostoxanthinifaciens]|uniref:hemerythrin domain-containing protein n=1 Tax=Sphingomonas nostoxanthinifaciens TaxID=2872652 RepID=UPI001CC1C4B8|nr:hemerythrin domain-containing protein [Sphingomonas nostoxanthinifaciens]UAK25964.1 hypothetical protein K8P63_07555 [Sphingomonas nostoxanthinifaciens]